VLRDGETVTVRLAVPGDEAPLGQFLGGLGLDARRLRFFTAAADIAGLARYFAAEAQGRFGLIALDDSGAIVGHALCAETRPGRAEVGVEVADRLHGQGLGTILVERLAELAEARGIVTLFARVLPENELMLDVFRDGFDARVRFDTGEDEVEFPTRAWRTARARFGGVHAPAGDQRSASSRPRSRA
jgi:GNAT superfamily N-acetyltransferase